MAKKQDISIAVIEEKVAKIEAWQLNADANHFPTIEKRFDALDRKLTRISSVGTTIFIVFELLLKYLS